MHLGYSLLTLFPGRVGGSETNVRGLLGEFADGNGPEQVTVLANRFVAEAPSLDVTGDDPLNEHGSGGGPMSLREVLVGMIEEYARHMGHVDLLRERIDGRLGQ